MNKKLVIKYTLDIEVTLDVNDSYPSYPYTVKEGITWANATNEWIDSYNKHTEYTLKSVELKSDGNQLQ